MIKSCKCGKEFTAFNTIQNKCYECQALYGYGLKKSKQKAVLPKVITNKPKKINHTVKNKRAEIRKLELLADSLYQLAGKKLFPISVTGELTEVIHHYIPKSQSNNLRYDLKNACPSTNGWHYRHHKCSDMTLSNAFIKKFGVKRIDYLTKQRRIDTKQTVERLENIIKELKEICYGKEKELPF